MKTDSQMVVIVPVYNEATVLLDSIRLLNAALQTWRNPASFVIIIASNGSTDGTEAIALRLRDELSPNVQLLECKTRGRGNALREAVMSRRAGCYLYIDVDLPCDLSDLEPMIESIREGSDLVVGRRYGERPLLRRAMTLGLRLVNRLVFDLDISDSQCGIKALSPAAAEVLIRDCRQQGWYLDTELAAVALRRGLQIRETKINWIEQRFAGRKSKVRVWRDSLEFLQAVGAIRNRQQVAGYSGAEAEIAVSRTPGNQ